jgi:PTS system cellobiose-specific IIA component
LVRPSLIIRNDERKDGFNKDYDRGVLKMNDQNIIMQIILCGGNSRSESMEAISEAKKGNIEGARLHLKTAGEELTTIHNIQTALIQSEAAGDKSEISLLMIHAQDHLMNAITIKDMAREFVDLYERIGK